MRLPFVFMIAYSYLVDRPGAGGQFMKYSMKTAIFPKIVLGLIQPLNKRCIILHTITNITALKLIRFDSSRIEEVGF